MSNVDTIKCSVITHESSMEVACQCSQCCGSASGGGNVGGFRRCDSVMAVKSGRTDGDRKMAYPAVQEECRDCSVCPHCRRAETEET